MVRGSLTPFRLNVHAAAPRGEVTSKSALEGERKQVHCRTVGFQTIPVMPRERDGAIDPEKKFNALTSDRKSRPTKPYQPHSQSFSVVALMGICKWNVEPWPNADSTQMRPPCISTICLAMARPRPVSHFALVFELSTWWNSSKMRR
jgi:hypothetical protein